MLKEQKLIEKIGETKIDKIELSNAIIHEIKDMYELMDKEILVDNSTLNKYVTTNGQMFSYLHLKSDKEIHSLKASCTGYGKQYVTLQTGIYDEIYGNMIGNTVLEYQDQIDRSVKRIESDYGIVADFSDAKLKYIEINRTFVTEFDFCDYSRVISLILAEMPRMNVISEFGRTKSDARYFDEKSKSISTYSAWNRKKIKGNGKQYKQITFYDKKNQIEIKFDGNYMRFEIKLKGAENIRNAFGTNKFYELTQEKVEAYFRNQVKELIEKPLDRWKYNRDKYLMALTKNQYRDNLNAWQVNTLRVLMNKEIEQGKPCLLDIEELYPLIDRMEFNKKGRIKRNLLNQAQKYEKIFCNNDTFKLQEIMDKLLI